MKEVKELFENASPKTATRQSIGVRRTLRRALQLGLLLSSLALRSALVLRSLWMRGQTFTS